MFEARKYLVVLCFLPSMAFAARTVRFSQAYSNRCPGDRAGAVITIQNVSNIVQNVTLNGNLRIGAGNGGCLQNYATLGIAQNAVAVTCAVWNVFQATVQGTTGAILQPGGHVDFLCSTPNPAGGAGVISGSIVVAQDRGAVQASGIVHSPQDTAALQVPPWPNYVFTSSFTINGSRPF